MFTSLLAAVVLLAGPGPFPLPTVAGKPVAAAAGQTSFRLPTRFEKVRAFYEGELKGAEGVTLRLERTDAGRRLLLSSKRANDAWAKAVVREGEGETVVEVTPVLRGEQVDVAGTPPRPLVQFVIGRDPAVAKAAASLDHSDTLPRR